MKPSSILGLVLATAAPIMALPISIDAIDYIKFNNTIVTNTTLPWFRNATRIAPNTYIPPRNPLSTTTSDSAVINTTTISPPQPQIKAAAAAKSSYYAATCTYRGNTILSTYYLDGLAPSLDVGKLKDRLNRKCGLTRHFLYDIELESWYGTVGLDVPGEGDDIRYAAEWNHFMATPECVAGVVAEAAGLGVGAKCVKVKGGPVADGDDEHGKRRPGRG